MVNRFSDFAREYKLEGEKVPIESILGKELVFTDFSIRKSKMDNCENYLTIQFENGLNEAGKAKHNVVFTTSCVLEDQFKKYKDKLPFVATIKQEGRYFTLS